MRRLFIAVGWFALTCVPLAQSDWTAVQQLTGSTAEIRVEAGNRRATGRIHRVTDAEIAVRNAYGEVAHFNRQDVNRVEQVIGPAGGKRRGMVIGFLAGAGLSAIATVSSGERGERRKYELPVIYGVTMGGGALLGAMLTESDRTHVIYTR